MFSATKVPMQCPVALIVKVDSREDNNWKVEKSEKSEVGCFRL
jgi:hypothetical protein